MMDELYPECAHGPLDEDDREWIQPCKIHLNTIYNENTLLLVVCAVKTFSAPKE